MSKRPRLVGIKLTEPEYQLIKSLAAKQGLTLSDILRMALRARHAAELTAAEQASTELGLEGAQRAQEPKP